ncbi:MAG: hypothetical protein EOO90_23130 [Pedobacter sp.]|nr:MAG: hypothetical protein EOO90_23130 [Pedobacter sp.]
MTVEAGNEDHPLPVQMRSNGGLALVLRSVNSGSGKLVAAEVGYETVIRAVQTYVVLSCDTDGVWGGQYAYGFNGKKKDNEISGPGNSLDFGARMQDTRLGRLGWTPDPLTAQFQSQSPYIFAGNNPILKVDKEGKYGVIYTQITDKSGNSTMVAVVNPLDYNFQKGEGLGWDLAFDYVQFASINLKTGKTSISERTNVQYVPIWERAWRRVEAGMADLDKRSRPGPLLDGFKRNYSPGKGGIMFSMTGGQGQEGNRVQFPAKSVVSIDDVLGITGNHGGSGGMGFLADWMDKLGGFNVATMNVSDYLGGLPNKQLDKAQQRIDTRGGAKLEDARILDTFCIGCGMKGANDGVGQGVRDRETGKVIDIIPAEH